MVAEKLRVVAVASAIESGRTSVEPMTRGIFARASYLDASGRAPFTHGFDQSAGCRLTNSLIVVGESYGYKNPPYGTEHEFRASIHIKTALELVARLGPSQCTDKPRMHLLSKQQILNSDRQRLF